MAVAGNITPRDLDAQFENWTIDQTGLKPADAGFFPAAIYEQFLASRATDILIEIEKNKGEVNKWIQQTVGCVELEEARVEECPCAPPSGCIWLRTVEQLPPTIGGKYVAITTIGGNLEKLEHFTYRDWQAMKFVAEARNQAERERGYYCIRNGYIYILNKTVLKAIAVSGVFYDPVEIQRTPLCGNKMDTCEPFLDYALYVDPGKYQKLLVTTFQTIMGMRGNAPLDTTNNSQPAVQSEPSRPY